MRITRLFIVWVALLAMVLPFSVTAQKTGRDRVLKIDAVELIDHGKEMEGTVEFQHKHGRYNFLFASAANLERFRAEPAKYEIQLGGACGRMGALSGEGSPKLFAVHDKRLFIFASEQCRRSFIADPGKFLLTVDDKPTPSAESLERGKALLDRAVKALGGASKLDSIATYHTELVRTTESGGKTYTVRNSLTLGQPGSARSENCWNDSCWSYTVSGQSGSAAGGGETEPMAGSHITEFWRGPARHPLALLHCRNRDGYIAFADGSTRTSVGPDGQSIPLDLLTVHFDGATTTLGVDPKGLVRTMEFHGRGPTLAIGQMHVTYSAFHDVGGFTLPGRVDVRFDGTPDKDHSGTFATQRINDPGDAQKFETPSPKAESAALKN